MHDHEKPLAWADNMAGDQDWEAGYEFWSSSFPSNTAGYNLTEVITLMDLGTDQIGNMIIALRKDPIAFGPDVEYGMALMPFSAFSVPKKSTTDQNFYTFERCQPNKLYNGDSAYSQYTGHYDMTFAQALTDFRNRGKQIVLGSQ